jgi:hypothetical protein
VRGVALPINTEINRLADWLELRAITAADRNASRGDLESALRAAPGFETRGSDKIEALTVDVFSELASRMVAAPRGYPFDVRDDMTIELRSTAWRDRNSYLLCLCLTWFGFSGRSAASAKPVRIFEDLAVAAARNYIGGSGVRFGSPRVAADLPTGFRAAINQIITSLQEGEGARSRPVKGSKDQGLDVIAWRSHPDGRPGKVVLFGACAAGDGWRAKINELNVDAFIGDWFLSAPVVTPIKAFFVPHSLRDLTEYGSLSRRGGILFDRCRIANWSPRLPRIDHHGDGAAWARAQIA